MAKYHVNSYGEPGACKATKRPCPYGGAEDHYPSKEEAAQAFEKKMENEILTRFEGKKADSADEHFKEKVARKRRVEDAVLKLDPAKTVLRVPHDKATRYYDRQRHNEYYVHPELRKALPEDEDLKEYLITVHNDDLTQHQIDSSSIDYDRRTGIVDLMHTHETEPYQAPEYDEGTYRGY